MDAAKCLKCAQVWFEISHCVHPPASHHRAAVVEVSEFNLRHDGNDESKKTLLDFYVLVTMRPFTQATVSAN